MPMVEMDTRVCPATGAGRPGRAAGAEVLEIKDLDVYYGQAHALQGVSLSLGAGVLAVVGRNGMGKSTLCNAITGLIPSQGSIRFQGEQINGLAPHAITRLGVAYVPQGRRVWRSLSVDEHLHLAAKTARKGAWTVERVYQTFPRLAERRNNGGAQLSGGEQQMLAIGRALLFNPRLLVMDEPTEGLAPVIVEHVANMLKELADEGSISVLLIEQNLSVALEVADRVAVMVNGRIAHILPAAEMAANKELQQRLLGLRAGATDGDDAETASADGGVNAAAMPAEFSIMRVRRANDTDVTTQTVAVIPMRPDDAPAPWLAQSDTRRPEKPSYQESVASVGPDSGDPAVYLAGCFTTASRELAFVTREMERSGTRVITVDLSTSSRASSAQIGPREIARHHPDGEWSVFSAGQEASAAAMSDALRVFLCGRRDLGALLMLAPNRNNEFANVAAALPVGVPKVVVGNSTALQQLAGTDTFFISAELKGLNRVTETVLRNAATSAAAMMKHVPSRSSSAKPVVCITALELTSPAVRHVQRELSGTYDCMIIPMAGNGDAARLAGLAESGLIAGIIDLTPADVSRSVTSGDTTAVLNRFRRLARSGVPYVGAPGALDVIHFPLGHAVPGAFMQRAVVNSVHDGTLVPVSISEAEKIGEWMGEQLNGFTGPVRMLLPQPSAAELEKLGLQQDIVPQQKALYRSLARRARASPLLQVTELPSAMNEVRFAETVCTAFRNLTKALSRH